ncbi:sulfatase [Arenibacter aquaticus]|uniref:Sulfatase n=1 Tax=Arenibacter aquaticus TaxID=2489054 RepID=A0A430K6K2_9FLAO|nr:sulfatase [Arenibacter aquaticus]RTE54688.1 sulfatase [Arenibacter aquaticus]
MKKNLSNIFAVCILTLTCTTSLTSQDLPNILWITSEDNSALLGCYGDQFASTPHLDNLAKEGFLYTHAYANAPVCAPARNTIITGIYANSGGHSNMRSYYPRGREVEFLVEAMRGLGYYCTNNNKTDYNTNVGTEVWDESSSKAHYKNAPQGKPWFAIFNTTISHESKIHQQLPLSELGPDPKKVPIAPYHPRTPDMERDWAQYYHRIQQMDSFVGERLKELEASGMAHNTIVMYYADHGGVLARSKRYVYETGTRVPLIVRIPEKYKDLWPTKQPNAKVDRLVSFVDLYPTLLNIIGSPIPHRLQGTPFLGNNTGPDPQYAYMFRDRMDEWYDMSRAVRSNKYRYIHNYMPHRIYALPIEYLFRAKSLQSWKAAYENGECNPIQRAYWNPKPVEELYDTENDPWEINNLAEDPKYADILTEMRNANHNWLVNIKDTGFMPEDERSIRAGDKAIYDYFQSGEVNIGSIIEAAEIASFGKVENKQKMVTFLNSSESAIRYWGAMGLLLLGEEGASEIAALQKAVGDPSVSVAVVAAEALYQLGEKEEAYKGFLRALKTDREFAQTQAMNAIYLIDDNSQTLQKEVLAVLRRMKNPDRKSYNYRAAMNLLNKWGITQS